MLNTKSKELTGFEFWLLVLLILFSISYLVLRIFLCVLPQRERNFIQHYVEDYNEVWGFTGKENNGRKCGKVKGGFE